MNLLCLFNILFKMKNDASPVVIASFDAEKAFLCIEWQLLFYYDGNFQICHKGIASVTVF